MLISATVLPDFRRPKKDAGTRGTTGVRGLLAGVLGCGEELDLSHSSFCVAQVSNLKTKADQQVWDKYKQPRIASTVSRMEQLGFPTHQIKRH